jgi:IS5 family transposase
MLGQEDPVSIKALADIMMAKKKRRINCTAEKRKRRNRIKRNRSVKCAESERAVMFTLEDRSRELLETASEPQ